MRLEMSATLITDSGMHLIWNPEAFRRIENYETWSTELEDDADIAKHISLGHAVPINIHSDGAWAITVRVDPRVTPYPTADEQRRMVASSLPYLFECGTDLCVSGIEYVSSRPAPGRVLSGKVPPGRYEVVIHLLDYDDIQQKTDAHPDFVALLGPARSTAFRQSLDTFEGQ